MIPYEPATATLPIQSPQEDRPLFLLRMWIWSLVLLTGALAYYFFWTVLWGFTYARTHQNPGFKREHMYHAKWLWRMIVAIVVDIIAGELLFGRIPTTRFDYVHRAIAITFFALIAIARFPLNGNRSPKKHRALVFPWGVLLGVITLFTGAFRIYSMAAVRHIPFP